MKIAIPALLVLSAASSAQTLAGKPVVGTRFEGEPWAIAAIGGRAVTREGAELRFNGGRLTGSAGCNSFAAQYKLKRDSLRVGSVLATQMRCAEPEMSAEMRLMAILAQPMRMRWLGRGTVMLVAQDGGIVLRRTLAAVRTPSRLPAPPSQR